MNTPALTPAQLGQLLRGQRKSRQLTQATAAASVGLLPKTVSKLELDPGTATIESLFKLLSALDLEIVVRSRADGRRDTDW
jgi:HTH-type transcriptional regulator / antitoxin HipB